MRAITTRCGVACFIAAYFPAFLAWDASAHPDWSHLPRGKVFAISAVLLLCALAFVATGIFLIARRRVSLPRRTTAVLAAGLLAIALLAVSSGYYLRAYSMTATARLIEELRQLDAAIEQESAKRMKP